jgi:hypothetical protein
MRETWSVQNDERIIALQLQVDDERSVIAALNARLSDPIVKARLYQATVWLDEVGMYLHSARAEKRTPEELARWLSRASEPLQWARERLKEIVEASSR